MTALRTATLTVLLASLAFLQSSDAQASNESKDTQPVLHLTAAEAAKNAVKKVPPHYPPQAKQEYIQGVVDLDCIIDEKGNVTDARPVSGHQLLVPAAIEAVRQWQYRPFVSNGQPVKVETPIRVIFVLNPPRR